MRNVSLKIVMSLLILAFAASHVMAEPENEDLQFLKGITHMGADWAVKVARGQAPNSEYLDMMIKLGKVIPYGRTVNGVRTESQLYVVERNSDRMIFLYPINGGVKLLLGAVLTAEAREAVGGSSHQLFYGSSSGREKFLAVFKIVADADQRFQSKYKKNALRTDMDPFGREIQQIGEMTLTDLDLNPELTAVELKEFLMSLFEATCENLLKTIK